MYPRDKCWLHILFNFINDLEAGIHWTLNRFAEEGGADTAGVWATVQKDLRKLDSDLTTTSWNSTKGNTKRKYKALYMGRNNSRHKYVLDAGQLESKSAEHEVGSCWDSKLTVSHKCTPTMKNAPPVMHYEECCQQVKGGGQPGEQKAQGGYIYLYIMYVSVYIYIYFISIYTCIYKCLVERVKRMVPDSSLRFPVTEQEAMDTNWNTENPIWTWEKNDFYFKSDKILEQVP